MNQFSFLEVLLRFYKGFGYLEVAGFNVLYLTRKFSLFLQGKQVINQTRQRDGSLVLASPGFYGETGNNPKKSAFADS